MVNISIDQLANEIVNAVREYTDEVSEAIEVEVEEVADKVLERTKDLARKRSGKYAKGFTKTRKQLATHGNRKYVIWNRAHYRRVHLLEFGHATANGGSTRKFPHLRPAHDEYAGELVENIKRIIQNGG